VADSQNNRIPAIFAGQVRADITCGQVTDLGFRPPAVESLLVSLSEFPAAVSPHDLAVTAERCAAQLLGGNPAGSAEEVAGRLLAIQAQDLRGARLAIRARSAGLSASDVDSALARRSLIVTWLNRGTLHLVRAEDYWWLHPLTTPQMRTGNSRRLAQEGVPPEAAERAVATVRTALSNGPLTRSQLRERVAAAAPPPAGPSTPTPPAGPAHTARHDPGNARCKSLQAAGTPRPSCGAADTRGSATRRPPATPAPGSAPTPDNPSTAEPAPVPTLARPHTLRKARRCDNP
jgi:Winged helix DNA-binding domain